MKKILLLILIPVLVLCFPLAACDKQAAPLQTAPPQAAPPETAPPDEIQAEIPEGGADVSPPFSTFLPDEFMSGFKGHELSVDDNPLIGVYETTSGCIMILMTGGGYIWQEPIEVPAITGSYEIFEGTVDGKNGGFALESETGPLYTVIVTFRDENAATPGTIQVFDFYKEGVYRVTDLFGDFWFEATRIVEEE